MVFLPVVQVPPEESELSRRILRNVFFHMEVESIKASLPSYADGKE